MRLEFRALRKGRALIELDPDLEVVLSGQKYLDSEVAARKVCSIHRAG
jgi:hypothetical protein